MSTNRLEGKVAWIRGAARGIGRTSFGGYESGGKIINFSSQAGRRGEPLVAVYCTSKAAVISITQSAGLALIKDKINVDGISPGVVYTPMRGEPSHD